MQVTPTHRNSLTGNADGGRSTTIISTDNNKVAKKLNYKGGDYHGNYQRSF